MQLQYTLKFTPTLTMRLCS